jgi:hypothetical protein
MVFQQWPSTNGWPVRQTAPKGVMMMSRLQMAIDQIIFARNYSTGLLDQTPEVDWFRQPPAGVSHIAWQVGHLAIGEYRLGLWRIRGEQPDDEELFSQEFKRTFGPNSVPVADSSAYPSPSEIRSALKRVHERVLKELPGLKESELDQPVVNPHPFAKTKIQALLWCAHHEMLHAGQIGLLRRQLGHSPMW